MRYTVPAKVEAVAIRSDVCWEPENFKKISTRQECEFEEPDLIFYPKCTQVLHRAYNAHIFGLAYAAAGYFGFKRNGHCLIVPVGAVETKNGDVQLEKEMGGDQEMLCPAI